MDTEDEFAMAALRAVMERAEPKLKAALEARGVSSPTELSKDEAHEIFTEIILGTTAETNPDAMLDALKHGMSAFNHPRFFPAFKRVQKLCAQGFDAFMPTSGVDAAIVLAGLGLPVAPFDRKRPRILAEPSSDIDTVTETFSRWKTAYVGYSPCDVPFYIVITDCVKSMLTQVRNRPELEDIQRLFARDGEPDKNMPGQMFRHGIVLVGREPSDTIETIHLHNPSPTSGSVAIYAGWSVGDVRQGAPNDGFVPVPLQFVSAVVQDLKIGTWMWKPVGTRSFIN